MWLSLSAVCARQAGIVNVLRPGSLAQRNQCVGQDGTERVKLKGMETIKVLVY